MGDASTAEVVVAIEMKAVEDLVVFAVTLQYRQNALPMELLEGCPLGPQLDEKLAELAQGMVQHWPTVEVMATALVVGHLRRRVTEMEELE